MNYVQREGRGSLFKNDRKQNDKHADYNGSIKIDGREYWLNAWTERSDKGTVYLSLSAKPKDGQAVRDTPQVSTPAHYGDDESEIPF